MNSQWYLNPVGGYGLLIAVALALVFLLTFFGLPKHRLSARQRAVLFTLRAAVILLSLFAMLRPALVFTRSKPQSATLVVLADRSRSMLVADALGGKTRWEVLRAALEEAQPAIGKIAEDFEVKLYTFDAGLHDLPFGSGTIQLGAAPDGQQSALGAALDDVLRREAGKRLLGVVLLSDGAQRAYAPRDIAPQIPARRLADLGFPLYTLAFGQPRGLGQARDIALSDLAVNQTVYVKNELTVRGTARIEGFGGEPVPVQLWFETGGGKMAPVAGEELKATQSGQSLPIELSTVPQVPGEYKISLRAQPRPGELVTTNNELSTFVTVLKGGINVLYLEGALRVDQIYLRRSLDASSDIRVDFVRLDPRDPKQRPADLVDRFRPGKYDVYMIGDVDSSQLNAAELRALAETVKAGAGLVMLGGLHTFGPGGYQDTPLAEVLPVEMDSRERQRLDEPIRTDVQLAGPLKMQPTKPLGERHYLLGISDKGERDAAWNKLPPLDGASKLGRPRPAAQVLAESQAQQPLLVVQEAGGRVMAFAGDTTWHWWMEGFAPEHRRFWRQVILWLARKDELSDGNVWVKLAERRFSHGQRVELAAGVQSPQGEVVADARLDAEVTLPDGAKQKVNLIRQGDQFAGAFDDTQTAGDYTIVVTAKDAAGAPLGTAQCRFLVYEQDLELDNAVADPSLLASLSAMTAQAGGKSLAPEELGTLLTEISQQPVTMQVETQVRYTPWDTWPFFILFIGLISGEWYLRKKWGLV